MKVYKCDGRNSNGDDCQNTTPKTNTWLTIGSNNDTLFVKNNLSNNRLVEMNNYQDIHFCSKDCFVNRFFTNSGVVE